MRLIQTLLAVVHLFGLLPRSTAMDLTSYPIMNLKEICKPDFKERDVPLRTTATVFQLSIEPGSLREDFRCHIEVDTLEGFGFHVFLEELNLPYSDGSSCEDYIQFGRDVKFITTEKSEKYCSRRPKLEGLRGERAPRNRFYAMEKDNDMDFWIHLTAGSPPQPRNLSVVITPVKLDCPKDDPHYRRCPGTEVGVRNELFCDSVPNCVVPSSASTDDETDCYDEALEGSNALLTVVVPILVVLVVLVVTVIVLVLRNRRNSREFHAQFTEPTPA